MTILPTGVSCRRVDFRPSRSQRVVDSVGPIGGVSTPWSPIPAIMQNRNGEKFKKSNMVKLQLISVLIDSCG